MVSTQWLWFISRGSGLVLLVLFTAVVVLGTATRLGWASPRSPRFFAAELHRSLALFTVALLGLHVVTAIADPYVSIGWAATAIPFLSPYRTPAIGLGTLAVGLGGPVLPPASCGTGWGCAPGGPCTGWPTWPGGGVRRCAERRGRPAHRLGRGGHGDRRRPRCRDRRRPGRGRGGPDLVRAPPAPPGPARTPGSAPVSRVSGIACLTATRSRLLPDGVGPGAAVALRGHLARHGARPPAPANGSAGSVSSAKWRTWG